MVNGSRYYRAFESVSFVYRSYHLPMPDLSPSTLTVLNSNFLQLGRRSCELQRTVYPRWLPVNTVIHTTLAGIEPSTLHATSSATETTTLIKGNIK